MNQELILALLEQAGVKYTVLPKDTVYEKFAELIVRECAGVGYDVFYHECELNVSDKIKQHFGVEE